MRKDLSIRTALDMQKFNKTFAGSQLMNPINPQQAALAYGSAIKAALTLVGTYTIYDDGFGTSPGFSNDDFVAHVSYNLIEYFSWADLAAWGYPKITVLKAGLCYVHLHTQGVLTLDGINPKSMTSSIRQSRGGIDIDQIDTVSTSLADTTGVCNGDPSVLFDVVVGDIIYITPVSYTHLTLPTILLV